MSSDLRRAFRCPDPLWSRYQRLAERLGCTVDSLVCEAMREYADRNDPAVAEPARERRTTPFGAPLRVSSAPSRAPGSGPGTAPVANATSTGPEPVLGRTLVGPPAPPRPQTPRAGTRAGAPLEPPRAAFQRTLPLEVGPDTVQTESGAPSGGQRMQSAGPGTARYTERTAEAPTPAEVPVSRRVAHWDAAPASVAPNSLESTPVPGTQRARARPGRVEVLSQDGQNAEATPGWVLTIEFMGATFPVLKERYIIGRDKHSCDLTIKDPNVSRQHAMIEYSSGRYYIVDLGSTNGIELQGQKITRHMIGHGDVFAVCDHQFRFAYRYSQ